jgi:hypothetical protein
MGNDVTFLRNRTSEVEGFWVDAEMSWRQSRKRSLRMNCWRVRVFNPQKCASCSLDWILQLQTLVRTAWSFRSKSLFQICGKVWDKSPNHLEPPPPIVSPMTYEHGWSIILTATFCRDIQIGWERAITGAQACRQRAQILGGLRHCFVASCYRRASVYWRDLEKSQIIVKSLIRDPIYYPLSARWPCL